MDGPISEEQLWSWIDRGAPELEQHLERHPEDRERVEALRAPLGALAPEGAPEGLPERIGPYRILARLGSGGMGVVYEALQPRPARRVALKVLRGAWALDERHRRLFEREIEVLGKLDHPGIARVFEAGETESGEPYLVMERVEGEDLDAWRRSGAPTRERRLRLFVRVLEAVEEAHGRGIVHRDLKPSNLLVDDEDTPKVLDFGLARAVSPGASLSLTAEAVVGTLAYMSPEQAEGASEAATPASDVFSLGVMLYELLTARRPHELPTGSLIAAVRQISECPAPSPRRFEVGIEPDLEAVVMKALELRPADRYADAGAMGADLKRFLEGRPVLAQPQTLGYRARRYARRNTGRLAVAGILLGLAASLWLLIETRPGGRLENAPFGLGAGTSRILESMRGNGYPKLAPWDAVAWRGERPLVRVDGAWSELLEIDGLEAALVVSLVRETAQADWQWRFEEDLVEVLARLRPIGELEDGVDLLLLDAQGERRAASDVPMTSDNRHSVWDRSWAKVTPFDDVSWSGETPRVELPGELLVRIDGAWWELRSLGACTPEVLLEAARELDSRAPMRAVRERLGEVLAAAGVLIQDQIELELRHPRDGRTLRRTRPLSKRAYILVREAHEERLQTRRAPEPEVAR